MNTSYIKIEYDQDIGKLRIETNINIDVTKKERNWVAYSPDFKTLGFSTESKEDAVDDFKKALRIFFKVHLKRFTLDETLSNFKWEKVDHTYIGSPRFTLDEPSDVIQESYELTQ